MHKVNMNVVRNFGSTGIWFSKDFELNFLPFVGMVFIDTTDSSDGNHISLSNYGDITTRFWYEDGSKVHTIQQDKVWRNTTSLEEIDQFVEGFEQTGWTRRDKCDIEALKRTIQANQEITKERLERTVTNSKTNK